MTAALQPSIAAIHHGASAAPRKVRVLMLITSTAGGVGQHAYMLARHLSPERFEVSVAFGPGYPLDASFAALPGCEVIHLSAKRTLSPLSNVRTLWQACRLVSRDRFDVVTTGQSIGGLLGRVAGALAGVPVLHVIHVYACRDDLPRWKRFIFRQIERGLDPITARYVAVSEATKQFGVDRGLFAPHRAAVIPNGVPQPPAAIDPPDVVRRELGLAPDALVVATPARFEPQKGLHFLLEAAARVTARVPAARFLIVGDGPLRSQLEEQAQRLGLTEKVVFAGWRNDVQRVLSAADLMALPSLWEAMPLTILEAMAVGCAVVATDVGGVKEVVEDQRSGRVVPPGDPAALADAMTELLIDRSTRSQLAQAGRERYERAFTLPHMVRQYEALLTEVARST